MKQLHIILTICLLLPTVSAWSFTEIMYDPLGTDTNREWVELSGDKLPEEARFVEDGGSHSLTLVSGQCEEHCILLIADDAHTLLEEYPSIPPQTLVYDSSWSSLRNSGETIALELDGDILAQTDYPPIARDGESIHFEYEWFSATPNPGFIMQEVPEFSLFSGLLLVGLIGFLVRKHI